MAAPSIELGPMSILAKERKSDSRRPGALVKRNRRLALFGLLLALAWLGIACGLYLARIGPPGTAF